MTEVLERRGHSHIDVFTRMAIFDTKVSESQAVIGITNRHQGERHVSQAMHCSAAIAGAKTLIVSPKCYGIGVLLSSQKKKAANNNMSML